MKKKFLITMSVVACALLLVVGSIAGTVAYLTSQSEAVKNTFTVGKISITLDEKDTDNSTSDKDRDILNTYHLLPGETYEKDPTVHVAANSEDAWLFVKVENSLANIEDANNTIASQINDKGWTTVISTSESVVNGVKTVTTVYAYKEIVTKSNEIQDKVVFEKIVIASGVMNSVLDAHADANVTVTAYAVQASADFSTAALAWQATFGA